MNASKFSAFFAPSAQPFAVILGTNEIASAVAVKLRKARFGVILSHDPYPPVIRRGMAFYDALFDDRAVIDGVEGTYAKAPGQDASLVKFVGNVPAKPPAGGTLRHKGWRATKVDLPALPARQDATIIAPAEIEIE